MGADDPYRVTRAVPEYPVAPGAVQVTARYDGLRRLAASSSQGFADTFGAVVPQAAPYSAVDGDPNTRWVTSAIGKPREQWLRMDFEQDQRCGSLTSPRSSTTLRWCRSANWRFEPDRSGAPSP